MGSELRLSGVYNTGGATCWPRVEALVLKAFHQRHPGVDAPRLSRALSNIAAGDGWAVRSTDGELVALVTPRGKVTLIGEGSAFLYRDRRRRS